VTPTRKSNLAALLTSLALLCTVAGQANAAPRKAARELASTTGKNLTITVGADGAYTILSAGSPVLRSTVEAEVDAHVLRSPDYPSHTVAQSQFTDSFGTGTALTVTHTGLADHPDLICNFRLYKDREWGEIEVRVTNTTPHPISVTAIRAIRASDSPVINLNGPANADRILSDSYSEDRPQLTIRDLGTAPAGMHRAVGSQLIFNRQSGKSLFIAALTSDRLLTVFHLKEQSNSGSPAIASFEAVAEGTTEIMRGESLSESPAAEQVELALTVNPGESLSSERLMIAVGSDYHAQLEQYGEVIRSLHHGRVGAPTPIGWWSWTAYYFGLSQATAGTNIEWLAQNLKSLGYTYFHIDEGYQYARGEYTTPDANLFPLGLKHTSVRACQNGLTFGVWTAPFEVSERASIYRDHKDWLLHNATSDLIHIGYVTDKKDPLYVLDVTNPGAQVYLSQVYSTLRDWGVRFIKMDFMDDSAVEGAYYRPGTTALEAQRIGLSIIRQAVGEEVVLDKDGSPMLNPVGIVDAGRISQDTGHTFEASRDAASGIAARYYMNRNFFIADPDAFSVSTQTVDDQSWHNGPRPLTLDDAKVSITLSAVSGGMYEIGDDLPTLGESAERLALVKNQDLLNMARIGRASIPLDLMTYTADDSQPSEFLLRESQRQSILTVFNWSDKERVRSISLATLGLQPDRSYQTTEVLGNQSCCTLTSGSISLKLAPHSVAVLKLVDTSIPASAPQFSAHAPETATAGESLSFNALNESASVPIINYRWDFGDGVEADGANAHHAYTHAGKYKIKVTATGIDGLDDSKTLDLDITGAIKTHFAPEQKRRLE
jgi:alpha-galactosidase